MANRKDFSRDIENILKESYGGKVLNLENFALEMKHALTCKICNDWLCDVDPCTLSCNHSFCRECLLSLSKYICPVCGIDFWINEAEYDYVFTEIIPKVRLIYNHVMSVEPEIVDLIDKHQNNDEDDNNELDSSVLNDWTDWNGWMNALCDIDPTTLSEKGKKEKVTRDRFTHLVKNTSINTHVFGGPGRGDVSAPMMSSAMQFQVLQQRRNEELLDAARRRAEEQMEMDRVKRRALTVEKEIEKEVGLVESLVEGEERRGRGRFREQKRSQTIRKQSSSSSISRKGSIPVGSDEDNQSSNTNTLSSNTNNQSSNTNTLSPHTHSLSTLPPVSTLPTFPLTGQSNADQSNTTPLDPPLDKTQSSSPQFKHNVHSSQHNIHSSLHNVVEDDVEEVIELSEGEGSGYVGEVDSDIDDIDDIDESAVAIGGGVGSIDGVVFKSFSVPEQTTVAILLDTIRLHHSLKLISNPIPTSLSSSLSSPSSLPLSNHDSTDSQQVLIDKVSFLESIPPASRWYMSPSAPPLILSHHSLGDTLKDKDDGRRDERDCGGFGELRICLNAQTPASVKTQLNRQRVRNTYSMHLSSPQSTLRGEEELESESWGVEHGGRVRVNKRRDCTVEEAVLDRETIESLVAQGQVGLLSQLPMHSDAVDEVVKKTQHRQRQSVKPPVLEETAGESVDKAHSDDLKYVVKTMTHSTLDCSLDIHYREGFNSSQNSSQTALDLSTTSSSTNTKGTSKVMSSTVSVGDVVGDLFGPYYTHFLPTVNYGRVDDGTASSVVYHTSSTRSLLLQTQTRSPITHSPNTNISNREVTGSLQDVQFEFDGNLLKRLLLDPRLSSESGGGEEIGIPVPMRPKYHQILSQQDVSLPSTLSASQNPNTLSTTVLSVGFSVDRQAMITWRESAAILLLVWQSLAEKEELVWSAGRWYLPSERRPVPPTVDQKINQTNTSESNNSFDCTNYHPLPLTPVLPPPRCRGCGRWCLSGLGDSLCSCHVDIFTHLLDHSLSTSPMDSTNLSSPNSTSPSTSRSNSSSTSIPPSLRSSASPYLPLLLPVPSHSNTPGARPGVDNARQSLYRHLNEAHRVAQRHSLSSASLCSQLLHALTSRAAHYTKHYFRYMDLNVERPHAQRVLTTPYTTSPLSSPSASPHTLYVPISNYLWKHLLLSLLSPGPLDAYLCASGDRAVVISPLQGAVVPAVDFVQGGLLIDLHGIVANVEHNYSLLRARRDLDLMGKTSKDMQNLEKFDQCLQSCSLRPSPIPEPLLLATLDDPLVSAAMFNKLLVSLQKMHLLLPKSTKQNRERERTGTQDELLVMVQRRDVDRFFTAPIVQKHSDLTLQAAPTPILSPLITLPASSPVFNDIFSSSPELNQIVDRCARLAATVYYLNHPHLVPANHSSQRSPTPDLEIIETDGSVDQNNTQECLVDTVVVVFPTITLLQQHREAQSLTHTRARVALERPSLGHNRAVLHTHPTGLSSHGAGSGDVCEVCVGGVPMYTCTRLVSSEVQGPLAHWHIALPLPPPLPTHIPTSFLSLLSSPSPINTHKPTSHPYLHSGFRTHSSLYYPSPSLPHYVPASSISHPHLLHCPSSSSLFAFSPATAPQSHWLACRQSFASLRPLLTRGASCISSSAVDALVWAGSLMERYCVHVDRVYSPQDELHTNNGSNVSSVILNKTNSGSGICLHSSHSLSTLCHAARLHLPSSALNPTYSPPLALLQLLPSPVSLSAPLLSHSAYRHFTHIFTPAATRYHLIASRVITLGLLQQQRLHVNKNAAPNNLDPSQPDGVSMLDASTEDRVTRNETTMSLSQSDTTNMYTHILSPLQAVSALQLHLQSQMTRPSSSPLASPFAVVYSKSGVYAVNHSLVLPFPPLLLQPFSSPASSSTVALYRGVTYTRPFRPSLWRSVFALFPLHSFTPQLFPHDRPSPSLSLSPTHPSLLLLYLADVAAQRSLIDKSRVVRAALISTFASGLPYSNALSPSTPNQQSNRLDHSLTDVSPLPTSSNITNNSVSLSPDYPVVEVLRLDSSLLTVPLHQLTLVHFEDIVHLIRSRLNPSYSPSPSHTVNPIFPSRPHLESLSASLSQASDHRHTSSLQYSLLTSLSPLTLTGTLSLSPTERDSPPATATDVATGRSVTSLMSPNDVALAHVENDLLAVDASDQVAHYFALSASTSASTSSYDSFSLRQQSTTNAKLDSDVSSNMCVAVEDPNNPLDNPFNNPLDVSVAISISDNSDGSDADSDYLSESDSELLDFSSIMPLTQTSLSTPYCLKATQAMFVVPLFLLPIDTASDVLSTRPSVNHRLPPAYLAPFSETHLPHNRMSRTYQHVWASYRPLERSLEGVVILLVGDESRVKTEQERMLLTLGCVVINVMSVPNKEALASRHKRLTEKSDVSRNSSSSVADSTQQHTISASHSTLAAVNNSDPSHKPSLNSNTNSNTNFNTNSNSNVNPSTGSNRLRANPTASLRTFALATSANVTHTQSLSLSSAISQSNALSRNITSLSSIASLSSLHSTPSVPPSVRAGYLFMRVLIQCMKTTEAKMWGEDTVRTRILWPTPPRMGARSSNNNSHIQRIHSHSRPGNALDILLMLSRSHITVDETSMVRMKSSMVKSSSLAPPSSSNSSDLSVSIPVDQAFATLSLPLSSSTPSTPDKNPDSSTTQSPLFPSCVLPYYAYGGTPTDGCQQTHSLSLPNSLPHSFSNHTSSEIHVSRQPRNVAQKLIDLITRSRRVPPPSHITPSTPSKAPSKTPSKDKFERARETLPFVSVGVTDLCVVDAHSLDIRPCLTLDPHSETPITQGKNPSLSLSYMIPTSSSHLPSSSLSNPSSFSPGLSPDMTVSFMAAADRAASQYRPLTSYNPFSLASLSSDSSNDDSGDSIHSEPSVNLNTIVSLLTSLVNSTSTPSSSSTSSLSSTTSVSVDSSSHISIEPYIIQLLAYSALDLPAPPLRPKSKIEKNTSETENEMIDHPTTSSCMSSFKSLSDNLYRLLSVHRTMSYARVCVAGASRDSFGSRSPPALYSRGVVCNDMRPIPIYFIPKTDSSTVTKTPPSAQNPLHIDVKPYFYTSEQVSVAAILSNMASPYFSPSLAKSIPIFNNAPSPLPLIATVFLPIIFDHFPRNPEQFEKALEVLWTGLQISIISFDFFDASTNTGNRTNISTFHGKAPLKNLITKS